MIKEFKLIQNENLHPKLKRIRNINYDCHLDNTSDIVNLMNKYYMLDKCTHEFVYLLTFNTNQDILAIFEISHGDSNKAHISIKSIITSILLSGGDNIILIHNHPNGNATPSIDDINFTNSLKYTLKLVDVELLDHIIIANKCYNSMKYNNNI